MSDVDKAAIMLGLGLMVIGLLVLASVAVYPLPDSVETPRKVLKLDKDAYSTALYN